MRRLVCVLTFLGIFLSASQLFAQRGGVYIGKIDLHTVFLLHPSMAGYSPDKQAFRINRDATAKKQAAAKLATSEDNERRLNAFMASVNGKINEENKSYDRKIDELSKKYLTGIEKQDKGSAAMNRASYKNEARNAEVAHNAKLTALYAQYSEAEERLMKATQFGYNDGYTTPDETEKRFDAIINEIRTYTQRIADQKGISVVLNTSYKQIFRSTSDDSSYVGDDMAYGTIFNVGFPPEIAKDEAAVAGYYGRIGSLVQNWLRNGSPIIRRLKNSSLDSDVFIGGVDLTSEVMAALFKAYKFDPNISNVVIHNAIK